MIVVAYAVAVLLPLLFLYIIYSQDLYGQGQFGHVLLAFGWGLVAFGGAYGLNQVLVPSLATRYGIVEAYRLLVVLIAPFVEEILKSLVFFYLVRHMTYFVDGAIYGFSVGIAFSILENVIVYLPAQQGGGAGLLAFLRVFSACLMHGAAAALVGAAVGRFRYGHGGRRVLSMVLGWALAIGLHMGFNRLGYALSQGRSGFWLLLGMLGIGIGGLVLIVLFIRWGLAEEKRWIEETLGLGVGVTAKEVDVVKQYDRIDELLEPFVLLFGDEKAEQVEQFLLLQAQMGIKQKARSMSQDAREQKKLDEEIPRLKEEMDDLRRKVGVYCMVYVRSIFPVDDLLLWNTLESVLAQQIDQPAAGEDMWSRLGQRADDRLTGEGTEGTF